MIFSINGEEENHPGWICVHLTVLAAPEQLLNRAAAKDRFVAAISILSNGYDWWFILPKDISTFNSFQLNYILSATLLTWMFLIAWVSFL